MAGSESPASRKPAAAPGSTACAIASPTRLMRRSTSRQPSGALPTLSASVATSARRMKA
jgi:hypothetical protein